MILSIIICTFNKSIELGELLEEISDQARRFRDDSARQIEIILVDNNSFDDTKEVAYRYIEDTELSVKYFSNEELGLSNCRNYAVTKASGDLLAFIFDNLTLDQDWLKEALKIARNCKNQEIGVYGGRVIPMMQSSIPAWMNMEPPFEINQRVFSGHSFGDEELFYPFETEFGIADHPCGANFLIRREVFDNCGKFRTDLGPSPVESFDLHDDYEFFDYLTHLQIPMLYCPQLISFRSVNSAEITKQYIRRWYFKSGRTMYYIAFSDRMKRYPSPMFGIPEKFHNLIPDFAKDESFGVPRYLYLKLVLLFSRYLFAVITFQTKKANWISYQVSYTMGEIEASKLVQERAMSERFSFKKRLEEKGILNI